MPPVITAPDAAVAGLLSFWSPCILPVLPFYLAVLAGAAAEVRRAGELARLGAAFAAGLTLVFVLTGAGATVVGGLFAQARNWLTWTAVAVLALAGWRFLAGRVRVPARGPGGIRAGVIGAGLLGMAFAFGWAACAGPSLAAILYLANRPGSTWQGLGLLALYGIGMTLPFALLAALAAPLAAPLRRAGPDARALARIVAGVMLIALAAFIATDRVGMIAQALLDWRDWGAVSV